MKRSALTAVAAALMAAMACAGAAGAAGKATVCFRCDDFFAVGGHPSKKFFETKRAIIALFRKHQIPLTIGVIPLVHNSQSRHTAVYKRLTAGDPAAALLNGIKNDRNFEIALHGLTHYPNRASGISEWMGLSAEAQIARMEAGKKILLEALDGVRPATFIPPWNSFDLNTLKAARANGFEFLSGDVGIVRNKPFALRSHSEREYERLHVIPATCSLAGFKNVLALQGDYSPAAVAVVLFHPYDFRECREAGNPKEAPFDLAGLDGLLREAKNDGRLEFARIKDLDANMITASRYAAACRYYVVLTAARGLLPGKALDLAGLNHKKTIYWFYLSEEEYAVLFTRALILLCIPGAGAGVLTGWLAALYGRRRMEMKRIVFLILMVFASLVAVLFFFEMRMEILSAPSMVGLLLVYCIFLASALLSSMLFLVRSVKKTEP